MHLDLKSTDFVVGKLLNTTNTMRLSIVMLSWQPRHQPSDLMLYIFRGVEIQTEL